MVWTIISSDRRNRLRSLRSKTKKVGLNSSSVAANSALIYLNYLPCHWDTSQCGEEYKPSQGKRSKCPRPCRALGPPGHLWRGWMRRTVPRAAAQTEALCPLKHLAQAGPCAGCSLRTGQTRASGHAGQRPRWARRPRVPGGHAPRQGTAF